MRSAAVDPVQDLFDSLQMSWPKAQRTDVVLDVDDPFLTGHRQTLIGDGRLGEICYVLFRGEPSQGLLLHTKQYYPPGGFRLPTGGIQPGEDPVLTLCREVQEETGIHVAPEDEFRQHDEARIEAFLGLVTYQFQHPKRIQPVPFCSFVFVIEAPRQAQLEPQDQTEEIAGWRWQTPNRLADVATELRTLEDPYWRYWGRFRAEVHDFVAQQWDVCH